MLLYHGSTKKFDTLIPHQAYDIGFEEGCQKAMYATTSNAKVWIIVFERRQNDD